MPETREECLARLERELDEWEAINNKVGESVGDAAGVLAALATAESGLGAVFVGQLLADLLGASVEESLNASHRAYYEYLAQDQCAPEPARPQQEPEVEIIVHPPIMDHPVTRLSPIHIEGKPPGPVQGRPESGNVIRLEGEFLIYGLPQGSDGPDAVTFTQSSTIEDPTQLERGDQSDSDSSSEQHDDTSGGHESSDDCDDAAHHPPVHQDAGDVQVPPISTGGYGLSPAERGGLGNDSSVGRYYTPVHSIDGSAWSDQPAQLNSTDFDFDEFNIDLDSTGPIGSATVDGGVNIVPGEPNATVSSALSAPIAFDPSTDGGSAFLGERIDGDPTFSSDAMATTVPSGSSVVSPNYDWSSGDGTDNAYDFSPDAVSSGDVSESFVSAGHDYDGRHDYGADTAFDPSGHSGSADLGDGSGDEGEGTANIPNPAGFNSLISLSQDSRGGHDGGGRHEHSGAHHHGAGPERSGGHHHCAGYSHSGGHSHGAGPEHSGGHHSAGHSHLGGHHHGAGPGHNGGHHHGAGPEHSGGHHHSAGHEHGGGHHHSAGHQHGGGHH